MALVFAHSAGAETMTLLGAVTRALGQSPELGQAEERQLAAEAVRDQASREWYPKVAIEGVAGLRRIENAARINLGISNRDERPLYGTVTLQQPVFDFGRRSSELRAREALAGAARQYRDMAGQLATYGAARAYVQVVLQQQIAEGTAANVAFHESMQADIAEGVAKGALSIAERQQAEERLAISRIRATEAQLALENARNSFAALIGVTPEPLTWPDPLTAALPASLPEAVAIAAAADPRIKEAELNLAANEALVARAKSELAPTIDLNGAASAGRDFDGYRGSTRDYRLLGTLRWQLFDGGVNAARVREARHRAEESRFLLQQVRRDGEREARDAWERIVAGQRQLREATQRTTFAGEVLASYRAQFGIGRRSLLDVLDAQSAHYASSTEMEIARSNLYLSQYAMLVLANRLRETLGAGEVSPRRNGPQ